MGKITIDKVAAAATNERRTIDGKTVVLSPEQIRSFFGKAICTGGKSWGCKSPGAHRFTAPRLVRVYIGNHLASAQANYKVYELSKAEARALYFCQHCKTFLGCSTCAESPTELICLPCHDWANQFGEMVHGKMEFSRSGYQVYPVKALPAPAAGTQL